MSTSAAWPKWSTWAEPLIPDLVILTGDNLGDPRLAGPCLELLSRLQPPLGMFAVTGNHEYGLSKGPLARPRDTRSVWTQAGITLLSDSCVALPPRAGAQVVLCGADYISGGFGLVHGAPAGDPPARAESRPASSRSSWCTSRPRPIPRFSAAFRWPSPVTPMAGSCA